MFKITKQNKTKQKRKQNKNANKTKQKGHISKFRNLLKDLTGIENDPFLPYGHDDAWKPAFRYSMIVNVIGLTDPVC